MVVTSLSHAGPPTYSFFSDMVYCVCYGKELVGILGGGGERSGGRLHSMNGAKNLWCSSTVSTQIL